MKAIASIPELAKLAEMNSGRRPPIDLRLLIEFGDDITEAEENMLAYLYREIQGAPRGMKTYGGSTLTYPDRYGEIDDRIAALASERYSTAAPLRIHDMAASNAITSLELFEKLKRWPRLEFTASDYFDTLELLTPPGSDMSVIVDRDRNCLQAVGKGKVLSPAGRLRLSELPSILRSYLGRKRAMARVAAAGTANSRQEISLWHRKCRATAARDNRFRLRREDLFQPLPGQYEVLRVMGTISRFPRQSLPGLFEGLLPRVAVGGLFVAGDTGTYLNDTKQATIFARRGRSFIAIEDWNGGFSLHTQVERVRLPES